MWIAAVPVLRVMVVLCNERENVAGWIAAAINRLAMAKKERREQWLVPAAQATIVLWGERENVAGWIAAAINRLAMTKKERREQ